jgi:predicted amidohydrolase YtcJ
MELHLVPVLYTGTGERIDDAALVTDGGDIKAVGLRAAVVADASLAGVPAIEHEGAILPGFVDAHVHLLRSARDADAVDCRPPRITSIAELLGAISDRARTAARSAWVDAAGYHELDLVERRHPTSEELHAAGDGHPVRLRHRSGHGAIVSPLGLQMLGIDSSTEDPPGGRIERDVDGRPTGMLTGRAVSLLRRSHATLAEDVAALCDDWLAMGMTTVCDAGPENDESRMRAFVDLARGGSLRIRLVLMRGAADALRDGKAAPQWTIPDDVRHLLRAGPVKFLLTHTGGNVHPAAADLAVTASHALLERLQHSGAAVVTHPLFVAIHGDRYMLDESEHPTAWLYRCGALLDAGIDVAVGSDAPVVAPSPLRSIAAAMTRRTLSGRVIAPEECVSFDEALPMHTANAARICGADDLGVLRPGAAADFVVLPRDPAQLAAEELAALPVTATYLGAVLAAGTAAPATEFLPC